MGIAIIGGTGLDALDAVTGTVRQRVETPYGDPSAAITRGIFRGHSILFLARHGDDHTLAPHQVNYRANLSALQSLGARSVIAVNAVGGIRDDLVPGALAVPDQIIDYTFGRQATFFEEGSGPVPHIDFTRPYSDSLRSVLIQSASRLGVPGPKTGVVHGVTQGPRLETAAEVNRLERDGCDIVGMTGMPEAALARELEMSYACCAVVVNRAAGRDPTGIHEQLAKTLPVAMDRVTHVVGEALKRLAGETPSTGV